MDEILEKRQRNIVLYDLYGGLLTEKQRNIFDLSYQNDYSIGEIAEELEISRQAVYDTLKRSEHILEEYEKKLFLAKKEMKRRNAWELLKDKIDKAGDCTLKREIGEIIERIDRTEEE